MNTLFRKLDEDEQEEFKQWAYENYISGQPINSGHHPIIQKTCRAINTTQIANIIADLKKVFPEISKVKDAIEYDGREGGQAIHLGDCGDGGKIDGLPACTHYDAHIKLINFFKIYGFYVECQEPGTYLAVRKN